MENEKRIPIKLPYTKQLMDDIILIRKRFKKDNLKAIEKHYNDNGDFTLMNPIELGIIGDGKLYAINGNHRIKWLKNYLKTNPDTIICIDTDLYYGSTKTMNLKKYKESHRKQEY